MSVEDIQSWREKGAVLVDGLLSEELVMRIRQCAEDLYSGARNVEDFGSNVPDAVFPSLQARNACLNEIPLSSNITAAVGQLLGCKVEDCRLSQCELWQKKGNDENLQDDVNHENNVDAVFDASSNNDQRIHIDAFNHYLTFPSDWDKPEAVAMIVYYADSTDCGGCTAIVHREGYDDPAYHPSDQSPGPHPFLLTPGGRADLHWMNAKAKVEATLAKSHPDVAEFRAAHLYPREELKSYSKGSILFYRMDVWHRGTPVTHGKVRYVHNLVYKKAHCDWITSWNNGAARSMYSLNQTMEKIIANRPEAVVLGYPAVDSSYWDTSSREKVQARYEFLKDDI